MNARWFDRIIYGGAWKQICFLIIIVISLIVLSCLGDPRHESAWRLPSGPSVR